MSGHSGSDFSSPHAADVFGVEAAELVREVEQARRGPLACTMESGVAGRTRGHVFRNEELVVWRHGFVLPAWR